MSIALLALIAAMAGPQQPSGVPSVTLEMVRDLAGRGDMAGARRAADQLVQISPRDAEAWYLAGFIRSNLQDFAGAIEAYRNASRLNPRHRDAWNNLGDLLRRTGQLQDARYALEQGRKADAKDPRLALNMALVLIQLREFPAALKALDDLEGISGRSVLTDFLRARTHLENGDTAAARPFVERFRLGPAQDAESFVQLARLLMGRGEHGLAVELLQSLRPASHSAASRFMLGQALYASEQIEKARDVLAELTAAQPANPVYLTWAGHAHHALGAVADARRAYEKAIQLDPAASEAMTELAGIELDAGNSESASSLASRALSLASSDSRTQFIAGQAEFRLQRWAAAAGILAKIRPDAMEYAQAQYMLSRAFRQSGETVKAEAALTEFRKLASGAPSMESLKTRRVR